MIINKLNNIWEGITYPFLENSSGNHLFFHDINNVTIEGILNINKGDVVALIGDFDCESIATLLNLLEIGAIVVPLTTETSVQHSYFIRESCCQYIFNKNTLVETISPSQYSHPLLDQLREKANPGLILFTTGSTGRPKAILHDFIPFIQRYVTPRPPLKAIAFLLFDHIGGLNTLFHMLFNLGQCVGLKNRSVESVIESINLYSVELLPTTPTFLRMMALYPNIQDKISKSLQIISYGTERMDQPTLNCLCRQFPDVDFRQTYGMSELGILRIKTLAKNSLFMKVGGEGVETKIVGDILYIRSSSRMLGYLNSESPFDPEGWYCTQDIIEQNTDGWLRVIGRDSEVINVGGLKFMPAEVENECLSLDNVRFAKAYGVCNPITGQHVELSIELNCHEVSFLSIKKAVLAQLKLRLPRHMLPAKIVIQNQALSHRFKKL